MTGEELWKFILSLSVGVPAFIGFFRLKRMDSSYYPFLVYIFVSLANELLVGLFLIHLEKKYNILNWELFNLFEALILVVQFHYWQVFSRYPRLFTLLFTSLVAGWLVENFVISNVYNFNPVFLISYSFLLVLLSVQTINQIIVKQNRIPLHKNAMFIICVALVLCFIYNIFVYTLLAKGISTTKKILMNQVFDIRVYINVFTNLLYGLAAWYIPNRLSSIHFFDKKGEKNK